MKKSFVLLFSIFLTLAFGTGAFAAENGDVEKALKLIEKTNQAIDTKIDKAVAKADKLQGDYFSDIQSVKGADVIVSLREEQSRMEAGLLAETDSDKAAAIKERLAAIDAEVISAENSLKQQSEFFAERTAQFHAELDQLIYDLDKQTAGMTAKTIEAAAELGVTAVCEWKHVKIAHKWVWIDPIQPVGS
ncbi:hypothetical protein ELQ35_15380 [Peribacillus cavernae]|uniref:OmpH family outer membrane protein n=1 Tax=Peribacillus cavernae TaxID=1674310 RepID=A0A433HGX4_9BACI|nr:hypothetical protein [Peribacillus cavernae]MDQ0220435.1 coproporphyrinogen III oxidase-like Fe-S oxidoreductase [Peribacillus cavernae]RUQ27549.1 hypothetical protein ELQ35_15380 [Peribacillus cavernae]